jgi:AAA+ ATPase superfamily predicted ATPase
MLGEGMPEWSFYGRNRPLEELRKIISEPRWFFCRVAGRRRIGKTTLLKELAQTETGRSYKLGGKLLYMQVPDSDGKDVAATFRRQLLEFDNPEIQILAPAVKDFSSMAAAIGMACRSGVIVVLDEFQYFTRAKMRPFNSFLQAAVDELRFNNPRQGGLFVLGSLQSEMNLLLEDKGAPLYGRITNRLDLDHWDFEDLLEVFSSQNSVDPSQWLTLWTFFEGVPKFYHDAYVQGLFQVPVAQFTEELIKTMFVSSSSPLAEEADTWFLRELRGKTVSVLHYISEHPGCAHGDLMAALNDPTEPNALGSNLLRLVNNYAMVDKLQPIFSDSKSRNARYYIADNFLQAWLAVAKPAREAARMRPVEKALSFAIPRLQALEGFAFEKLIRKLHLECSQKGKGDFELTSISLGYWNRARNPDQSIEIDLVALDETSKTIRFGSCKRSESSHDHAALAKFERHIEGFLATKEYRHLQAWKHEKVLFSPTFAKDLRKVLQSSGFECRDLNDYARLFA